MNTLDVVRQANFSEEDFTFDKAGCKIRLKHQEITSYVLAPSNNVTVSNDGGLRDDRMKLSVQVKLGIINLAFTPKSNGRIKLFDLPDNAPVPVAMMTAQSHSGGLVWIEAGSREVFGRNLQANELTLLTLTGFFTHN